MGLSNDTPGGFPPGLDGPTGEWDGGWVDVDEMAFGLSRLVSKARPRRRPRRPDALRNLKSNHVCFKIVRPEVWPPGIATTHPTTQLNPTETKAKARIAREKL